VSRPPQPSFDRVRPRSAHAPAAAPPPGPADPVAGARPESPPGDREGRRALFSVDEPAQPAFGSVSIECSRCRQLSVLGLRQALRLALPSVYLPVIRGRYPTWLRCPACRERAWTRVRLRV
jgi:hypothetical protein